jgi:hypothetical protein
MPSYKYRRHNHTYLQPTREDTYRQQVRLLPSNQNIAALQPHTTIIVPV